MASTTLDRLLRIQSTAAEPITSSKADAGSSNPAPPPVRGDSSPTGRRAAPYSKQFRVAFDFLQRYTDKPPRSPDDWSAVCDDMVQRSNEGGNDELLMDLLCAAFTQIERAYKASNP